MTLSVLKVIPLLQNFSVQFSYLWHVALACPSGRVVKPPAAVHAGQGSLPVRVEALVHPLWESGLLARVHAIGLLLDRHRGFTCVLFKM